jgi:hypothetical protein
MKLTGREAESATTTKLATTKMLIKIFIMRDVVVLVLVELK